MASKIIIAAIAALAMAVPQHAEHLGKAQIARSNQLFARDLTERTISQDGSCGTWSGMTCPNGGCCSAQGWCGSTSLHCGTGCQSAFGSCGDGSDTSPAPDSTTPPVVVTTTTAAATVATNVVVIPVNGNSPQAPGGNQQQQELPAHHTTTTSTTAAPTTAATTAPAPAATTTTAPSSSSGSSSGLGDVYKMYLGDGTTAQGWPDQSQWADFETLFAANSGLMQQSCGAFNMPNNSEDEINTIKSSLLAAASSYGVDSRFLLAIMMQESGGCVRAPTTNYGVRNPGLFQSHDGQGTCNDGSVQSPCPSSEIQSMINDGAGGTAAGDGLKQTLAQTGRSDVSQYYRAARIYNSGSIAADGLLQDGIATHCYSSDVANRLTGWVHAAHGCSL